MKLEAEIGIERQNQAGIFIAGMGSGCGKTTVVCALMQALKNRGIAVAPFKSGPDYIDPMLHRHIVGTPSYNLDPFFMEKEDLKKVFSMYSAKREFSVVEGVMGFYDGIGLSHEASSYTVSELIELPVILVLSVRGMSTTIAALLKGMLTYQSNRIQGVLLNRCSKPMYQKLKGFLEKEFGISVLGYLPVEETVQIKERHLGLMTADEIDNLDDILETLGQLAEDCFEMEDILQLGGYQEKIEFKENNVLAISKEKILHQDQEVKESISIGVASDSAFCFCYEDNLEYLKEQGVTIQKFSPLVDTHLPKGIQALYLPGGYPELYGEPLEQNESMKQDIKAAIAMGIPVIAECGGYLYLCESIITRQTNEMEEEKEYKMLGIIPQKVEMTGKLNMQFGYVTITAKEDGLLGSAGEWMKGHEFHYSKEMTQLDGFLVEKADKSRSWSGGYHSETIYAGYPHFHFRSNQEAMKRFLKKAKEFKRW